MDQLSSQGRSSKTRLYLMGVVCVVASVLGTAYYMRQSSDGLANAKAAMEADVARGPRVVVANVVQGPQFRTIQLLGDARPYQTITVFAKVSGYLKSVLVDMPGC